MFVDFYKKEDDIFSENCMHVTNVDDFRSNTQDEEEQIYQDLNDIEDIYMQIEICWKTLDYEPIINYLQEFLRLIRRDNFQLTTDFFINEVDDILFNLVFTPDEDISKNIDYSKYSSTLQNLSLSIISELLFHFDSMFPPNSLLNLLNHIIPLIVKQDNHLILKTLYCLLKIISSQEDPYILEKHVDPSFLLSIIDQQSDSTDFKTPKDSQPFFYDGDTINPKINLVKSILLQHRPNLDNLFLFYNNGNCSPKRFSLFINLLLKDRSLISSFDSSLYISRIQEILEKSRDYSIVYPCLKFLIIFNVLIDDFSIIFSLFSFIQIIPNCEENYSCQQYDLNLTNRICSISLNCISCFVSKSDKVALFCIEKGIINLIVSKVKSVNCQNQIKRESARCLCNLIINVPIDPLPDPTVLHFYQSDEILDLLFNILEYDEIDMNVLILRTLVYLAGFNSIDLSFFINKCYENINIFDGLLTSENKDTVMLTRQFLEILHSISHVE